MAVLDAPAAPSVRSPARRRWDRGALWLAAAPVFVFLLAPSLIIVPMALTPKDILEFPPSGLSLHTFGDLLASEAWMSAIRTSLTVAVIAVSIAAVAGTLAALGLHRAEFRGRGLVVGLILLPLVIPVVVLALGYFSFLARLRLIGSELGIALAHSVLATPYVYLVVSASLAGLDPALVRSARSLGAGPVALFRHVYLPAIRPGLAAGMLFGFAVSFDEAVIAYFLQSPSATTLPVKMFTDLQYDLTPLIAAVSTVLLLLTTALLIVQVVLMRRRSRVSLLPAPTPIT
jgi:putative spermidine/putrescine transport system permease protein